jgi:uncharacterized protein
LRGVLDQPTLADGEPKLPLQNRFSTMILSLSPIQFVAAALLATLGSALQASIGFGLALVLVPTLALIDIAFVPGPTLMANMALAALLAVRGRVLIGGGEMTTAVIGLVCGTLVALAVLAVLPVEYLPKAFAAVILLVVATSAAGLNPPLTRTTLISGCAASGFMGTVAGIHGPLIALLYQRHDPDRIRATLGAIYCVAYGIALTGLAIAGLLGLRDLMLGLALLPGVAAGYLLAPLFARRLDAARMRWAILAVSTLGALSLLFRG